MEKIVHNNKNNNKFKTVSASHNGTFDWSLYENGYVGGYKLVVNKTIKTGTSRIKVYSHEHYAPELYKLYEGINNVCSKDLIKDNILRIVDLTPVNDTEIAADTLGGSTVIIDLNKEKKFISMFGINDPKEFVKSIKNPENKQIILNYGINGKVMSSGENARVSLWDGHTNKIETEFMDQIKNPTTAYVAHVKEINKGGYVVSIMGIDAFMPGSLAAPNKLTDFNVLLDKDVMVMIESFIPGTGFIVSHKKYLKYLIPMKLKELELNKWMEGIVTGSTKFGIFIEFNDIFTGMIHTTKMSEDLKNKFMADIIKPGDKLKFYIDEITDDNRIILSDIEK